jgi:hypothetical protein
MPSVSNLDKVKDGKPEGRITAGFLTRGISIRKKMASGGHGTATLITDSRLPDAIIF